MQSLTPEEIQALLQQSKPTTEKESGRKRSRPLPEGAVQPYDMRATLTLTPRQRAMIRQWADQLVQSLRYALIPSLRMALELRLNSEGLVSLSELANQWKGRAYVIPVTTSGKFSGDHFLAISVNLAMVVIDRLLGGPGKVSSSSLQRPLSRLEMNLLLKFMERIAQLLLEVIAGQEGDFSVQVQSLWTSEEQITMLTDQITLYNLRYNFQLGQESGNLWIGLRADALKSLEQISSQFPTPNLQPKLQHPAMSLPVTMKVVLATGQITVKELKQLRKGDVILLNEFKGEPAKLVWNGRVLCKVKPGVRNGHLAVQVLPSKTQKRGEVK